ncbi:uncharacterized protein cubi_03035 [Cryptosporidium ubiquitum]|uniref:Uncharacterized protein n=1 Tax=Cryptosporidium ubiquitum TaxID=857276 RepID=A0A1J4ML12_9CRYT|nr:uncharacterized protein cubi_03035 [Cryptosporidium ubiquitum]OII74904.1 hypothetical protein cubi_03035 [Cryptosporidium ubiquitum]
MNTQNKSKFIRIIGDKRSINESQIKSVAINALLSENSFLICGLNGNACENFLYGKKFTEIPPEDVETKKNDYEKCLFEELVNNLFTQTKLIKQYFEKYKSNEIYFNKIKCSFVLISDKTEDPNSGCIYDVFQGLSNPVDVISDNGVKSLNVLEVDANDPIQLLNMINVARKLQFENLVTRKELFHTLFIFDIESAIYDKNIVDFYMFDKLYKHNKIYVLDYQCNFIESNTFVPSKFTKLEDINDSAIYFFRNLISIIAKTSSYLLEILSKAIFGNNYSSVIYVQCNGLNLFIDKCNMEPTSLLNSNINPWNKYNNYSSYSSDSKLLPLIKKFHNYCLFFRNSFLSLKSEESYEKMSFQDNNVAQAFEDLKLVLFNLCGKIIKHEDLLFNIEHIGDITRLIDNNDSYIDRAPIHFSIINQCLNDWYEESERNKKLTILGFKNISQDEYLDENDTFCTDFTPGYINKLHQFSYIDDNNSNTFNYNLDFGQELTSYRKKNQSYNLNKSVIGINNEHLRVNNKSNAYKLNSFGEKHTRSYLSIPNYFKFKHSETPISKILLAVNTARRRVREYRHKQQAHKDLTGEFNHDTIKSPESNFLKDKFWNKTLSKRPIFSYNKNIEIGTNRFNAYSVQDKIEIHDEPFDSKKDAEVQVNNINFEGQSEYFCVTNDKVYKSNMNKIDTTHNDSIEISKNCAEKKQTIGLKLSNEGVGINNNLFKNSIGYKWLFLS